jgi:hypothetical protein
MQHESLIATASNEHTHRRLAGFSGRGRGEELGAGSMIEGDFIDSRRAAIRHNHPGCGADVVHDELQVAAFTNKLAGFDGAGSTSGVVTTLLPERPYDYNLPRRASPSLVLVKHLKAGNTFNHLKPAHCLPLTEASVGTVELPTLPLRSSLSAQVGGQALCSSQPPACVSALLAMHTAVAERTAAASAARKRKASAWVPLLGCDCGSEDAHNRHVRKCARWACNCKPPKAGSWGGDNTHAALCVRSSRARHVVTYVAPQKGDRVAMIGDARRGGCADLVHDGRGWMADPHGRAVEHSAWVVAVL